ERMVKEAESYRGEDEKQRDRITARNTLESYAFQIKSSIEEEAIKSKISEADRKKILDKVEETMKWLDSNALDEKDEFEHNRKELEAVCNPIMTKLYQQAGAAPGGGMPGGFPGGFPGATGAGDAPADDSKAKGSGPTIEEVD